MNAVVALGARRKQKLTRCQMWYSSKIALLLVKPMPPLLSFSPIVTLLVQRMPRCIKEEALKMGLLRHDNDVTTQIQ
jgi:hypothetical protein